MATREDFDGAVRLYTLLNGSTGGQTTKLTKMESDLLGAITALKWVEFTIPMLQKATGFEHRQNFAAEAVDRRPLGYFAREPSGERLTYALSDGGIHVKDEWCREISTLPSSLWYANV